MTKESAVANISAFGLRRQGLPSNLISVDFINKTRLPENVINLPETGPKLTIVTPEQRVVQIIEFPLQKPIEVKPQTPETASQEKIKTEIFNPQKQKAELLKNLGFLVRRSRRKSRCDGMHDAEEDPCGSPRCKTKGRRKLKDMQNKDVTKRKERKSVILNGKKIK